MNVLKLIPKDKHDDNLRRAAALGEWKQEMFSSVQDAIRAIENDDEGARLLLDLILTDAFDAGWRKGL